jgi:hypothetical protein
MSEIRYVSNQLLTEYLNVAFLFYKKSIFLQRFDRIDQSFRGVAQLASALAWGARGRPFKSDHPDFFFKLYVTYHVYFLKRLKDNKYYIGSTGDIQSRLYYHNSDRPNMAQVYSLRS